MADHLVAMSGGTDGILQSLVLRSQGQDAVVQSLIDSLKVSSAWNLDANKLCGRLKHFLMESRVTKSMGQYLGVFGGILDGDVADFMKRNCEFLDRVYLDFRASPHYDRLLNLGMLSATRFYDTYLLRNEKADVLESVAHFYIRQAAFCACRCEAFPFLKKTIFHIQKTRWNENLRDERDLFIYFFAPLSEQTVCCSTPMLRLAGVRGGNLSSCFIADPDLSTAQGVRNAVFRELPALLQSQSGVGVNLSRFNVEGKNVASCLRVINSEIEYYNDNNIRPVSVAAYMELWHHQIQEFLSAKLPENAERCGSLFQGVCVPDLFFKMYENDPSQSWYLFDPETGSRLSGLYGEEFEREYMNLVEGQRFTGAISVKSLMFMLINTIVKTGTPYIISKDACNRHHYTETQGKAINCANLCAEVVQQPDGVTSTCNLVNICLPRCLERCNPLEGASERPTLDGSGEYLFSDPKLQRATEVAVFVVNCGILGGSLPTLAAVSGQARRSMGIGVQGLADVFAEMGLMYIEPCSRKLDIHIFEQMYFNAVRTSHEIVAVGGGGAFPGWEKSDLAQGKFHWEGWPVDPRDMSVSSDEWNRLRRGVMGCGTFNSQFIALMPTVGSSQLTGFSESFYPFYANMASKVSDKTEIIRPNMTFLKFLRPSDRKVVRYHRGEVKALSAELRERYSLFYSAFDYAPEDYVRRAADRAPFVDQSQSLTLFLNEEEARNASHLKNLLVLGHSLGLKTLMYYCRIKKEAKVSELECLQRVCDSSKEKTRCDKRHSGEGGPECLACQ